MQTKTTLLTAFFFIISATQLLAQEFILAVNSATGTKKIYLINGTDGTIIDNNFIDLAPQSPGTPKGIVQVEDNIWITDQTADKIFIYDNYGVYQSSISTGLDNIRGIALVNDEVWVANDGGGNGATADSVARYTTTGSFIGYTTVANTSIFDVLDGGNNKVYISGLTTQGIQIIDYAGVPQGNLVQAGVFQNMQQMNLTSNGNLLVAVFQNHSGSGNNAGVYLISTTDGSILNSWLAPLMRGVIELGDGNILYSNDTGLHKINTATNTQSTVLSNGGFQYLTKATLPHLGIRPTVKSTAKLYPNPTINTIQIDSHYTIETLHVYTLEGKLVLTQQPHSNSLQLNVEHLAAGNYIISLQAEGNTTSHKFTKL